MAKQVSYGPHLFPGDPSFYVRCEDTGVSREEALYDIEHTLTSAFSGSRKDSVLSFMAKYKGVDPKSKVEISFMNYGNTELVYRVKIGDDLSVAALVNQPHTPLGVVRREFSNLQRLNEMDPRFVVKPLAYFSQREKGHELYVTEYSPDALCVAVLKGRHGVYDPLPEYHFEEFSRQMSAEVNSSMIALLVNYYDIENNRGLSGVEMAGNDFMLTRDFQIDDLSSVERNLRIISARGFVEVPFDKYLGMLEQEFLYATDRDEQRVIDGRIVVNTRSLLRMADEEIRDGFDKGFRFRHERRHALRAEGE